MSRTFVHEDLSYQRNVFLDAVRRLLSLQTAVESFPAARVFVRPLRVRMGFDHFYYYVFCSFRSCWCCAPRSFIWIFELRMSVVMKMYRANISWHASYGADFLASFLNSNRSKLQTIQIFLFIKQMVAQREIDRVKSNKHTQSVSVETILE